MTMRELSKAVEEASQKIAGEIGTHFLTDFVSESFERFGGAFSSEVADMELPVQFVNKWQQIAGGESPLYNPVTGERTEAGKVVWDQNRKKLKVPRM